MTSVLRPLSGVVETMKATKAPLRAVLDRVPLRVWQHLFPKDVIGPSYHVVADTDLPHIKYYPYKNSQRFEADVVYAKEGQRLMRYDDLVRCRRHGNQAVANAIFFTFDDGLVECFDVIRPILLKHKADAAFFIPSDFIDNQTLFFETQVSLCLGAVEVLSDELAAELVTSLEIVIPSQAAAVGAVANTAVRRLQNARLRSARTQSHKALLLHLLAFEQDDAPSIDQMCESLGVDPVAYFEAQRPYMTTEQLRQLVSDGFTVGSHGVAHLRMQRMSTEEMEREIVTSCDIVRQVTGQARVPFAFPYSGEGINRRFLADLLARYEFIELFFDTGGFCSDAPFIVNRFQADLPTGCIGNETNLPSLLQQEWSRRSAWTRQAV